MFQSPCSYVKTGYIIPCLIRFCPERCMSSTNRTTFDWRWLVHFSLEILGRSFVRCRIPWTDCEFTLMSKDIQKLDWGRRTLDGLPWHQFRFPITKCAYGISFLFERIRRNLLPAVWSLYKACLFIYFLGFWKKLALCNAPLVLGFKHPMTMVS